MNFEELIDYCSNKKGAEHEYKVEWEVTLARIGGKIFAMIADDNKGLRITLKCEPQLAELLRENYTAVIPGYYMNKKHWNTVSIDGSIPEDEIKGWIDMSYDLVFKSLTKKEQNSIII